MKTLEEIKEAHAKQLNKTVKEFDEYDVHICNVAWFMVKIAVNSALQEAMKNIEEHRIENHDDDRDDHYFNEGLDTAYTAVEALNNLKNESRGDN